VRACVVFFLTEETLKLVKFDAEIIDLESLGKKR
jgi:hypothetical protein